MNLEEMRKQEDEKLTEYLMGATEIVLTKCKRCNAMGCMGCVFSPGDGIKGYLRGSLMMMTKQRPALEEKIDSLLQIL